MVEEYDVDAAILDVKTQTFLNDSEHREIHEGDHFFFCAAGVRASGVPIEVILTTGAIDVHLTFEATGSDKITFLMFEDPTTIVGGTGFTPFNNKRKSAIASTVGVTVDPASIGGDGTLLLNLSAGAAKSAGILRREREIILKRSSDYLFRITSQAANNLVSYCANWYEFNIA